MGTGRGAGEQKGQVVLGGKAIYQVWPFWTMDLSGGFRKLPASLCLSFPIVCEMEGWDVTVLFRFLGADSSLNSFKQNPAVVLLLRLKWEAGLAGNESPALRGVPSPHHSCPLLEDPSGPAALFGTPSGLWCQSASLFGIL